MSIILMSNSSRYQYYSCKNGSLSAIISVMFLYFHPRCHHNQLRSIICGSKIACFVQLVFVAALLSMGLYLYTRETLYACNNTEQKGLIDQLVSAFNIKKTHKQKTLLCANLSDHNIQRMYQDRI